MMTDTAAVHDAAVSPMAPVGYRVRTRVDENAESVTLTLEPIDEALATPAPGQFVMLYAFGVGEIPMSFSGGPPGHPSGDGGVLTHTIRSVGRVSAALHDAAVGDVIGVRGPFGIGWDLDRAAGRDVVIVAGGCGLAPLRPLVLAALAEPDRYGSVVLLVGERTPEHFLFGDELDRWATEPRLTVTATVDKPNPRWSGRVGVVTEPLRDLTLRPQDTTAFLCGPENMIRAAAAALMIKGVAAQDVQVSLERNMRCGIGWCGHCQLGPLLLCRDGPVVGYHIARPLLETPEL
jgi:NAD(P)H-flavin reductase